MAGIDEEFEGQLKHWIRATLFGKIVKKDL